MAIHFSPSRNTSYLADNMYQRSELDWLIYNKPLEYADLVLNGGVEEYLGKCGEHSTMED